VYQPHFDANCLPSEEPSTAATSILVAIAATAESSTIVVLVIQPYRQRMAVPAASEIKKRGKSRIFF
jgi:hypothetical protein